MLYTTVSEEDSILLNQHAYSFLRCYSVECGYDKTYCYSNIEILG